MARSRALLALFVLALAALGAMSGAVWTSAASGAPGVFRRMAEMEPPKQPPLLMPTKKPIAPTVGMK